jgi:hypothetical protein
LAAVILLLPVGNSVVRGLLQAARLSFVAKSAQSNSAQAGRIIGILERILMTVGILFDRWEILAAVIALKSVARFREMDEKDFAEYFLVGLLGSMLWTILIAGGWMLFDANIGIGIHTDLVQFLVSAP